VSTQIEAEDFTRHIEPECEATHHGPGDRVMSSSHAGHQQVHNLLIRFSRFFPLFGSQKKLDRGKFHEITYKFLMEQVANRVAFWKIDADCLACDFVAFFRFFSLAQAKKSKLRNY
jgi:hypothetical protein